MFDSEDHTSLGQDVKGALASNLRRLRIARRISLSELARATAIGKATLSGIENANANPTVATLALLASALRVPIGELLEEPPFGEVRVVRAPGRRADVRDGVHRRVIDAFAADGEIELIEMALPARHVHALDPGAPGAREEMYVLQGTLIAGPVERITEMAAGDYASFPADVARMYESGRHPARALVLAHGTR